MDPQVEQHYESAYGEDDRLGGWSLERIRTEELLASRLPAGGRVLDAGGGTGRYAGWLAGRGHEVVLLDPVERHVTAARSAAAGAYEVERGDARALPHPDGSFDAVLLLGPLYHLVSAADRAAALAEAFRVVRPGGPVAAAGISRTSALLDGFAKQFILEPDFRSIAEGTTLTGQHRNPTGRPEWFTTAYFHAPSELASEFAAAGAVDVAVHGVEGPAWVWGDRGEEPDDDHWRDAALWAARLLDAVPEALILSAHLLAVGHRPPTA